ncbi:phage tail tape measure protein [Halalkalibacter alkalisediminis]|uniref:Phage tail tape measure protein n=1 Tax=Halalkalibacter alkalisediminis TaxID=935616 RepID=A0ABV6NHF3_9BACI|nr:phage tail tape measure protein [Halalkalibacter alkalisediminis]
MALIVKIGANLSNFDKQMKKLTKDVNTVGSKLKDVGGKLTAGVTLPLVAIAGASIKTGMEFEKSMSKVAAISGGTASEMEILEKKAREMGSSTQFSASETAEAFGFMAMAGWKTEEMLGGIGGVMALAAASGEDLATVSDIMTDSLTAFGMSAQDSGKFADILAAASSNANTNVGLLGESFKYVAPVAGALGYSVDDTTKALSLMANSGIKGSQAGTALRTMMTNLASPTKAMKDAMDDLGISLTNSDGSMKTLDEVMHDLRGSFDGLDESQQASYASTIFGKEAMSGALAIINASEDDYNKLSDAIDNSEGSAQEMADTMNDNLAGRLKEMQSALQEMGLVIYERLQPALEKVVEVVKSLADRFNSLSPRTQTLIIALAAIAAAIGPILMVVGIMIILFGKLSAACAILGISMAAAFWWVLAIIAAFAAIVAVVVYWEEIKTFFINLWDKLKQLFFSSVEYLRGVIQSLHEKAKPIIDAIGTAFSKGWNFIKQVTMAVFSFILSYYKAIWSAIWYFIEPIVTKITNVISKRWNKAKETTSNVLSAMRITVSNIFQSIKTTAQTMWNSLVSVISKPVESISSKVSSAFSGMKETALGAWEGLKSGMKTAINGIIKLVNKFIGGFNTPAKLLNKLPGVDAPIIPNIPMLATGGNVTGSGAFIAGEAGAELVQKSGSSVKVTPLSSQEKSGGIGGALGGRSNGGSTSITIPLIVAGREIARAVVGDLDTELFNKRRVSSKAKGAFR